MRSKYKMEKIPSTPLLYKLSDLSKLKIISKPQFLLMLSDDNNLIYINHNAKS